MDDSAIICDEITASLDEEKKTIPTNFLENKATSSKRQNFCILLSFLLISTIDSC